MEKKCARARQAIDVNIIRRKRIGRFTTKDKDTELNERASVLRYTFNACPFKLEFSFKHIYL